MKKRIQREIQLLVEKKSLVILWGILAAAGGILLWVHGSMAPWIFRVCRKPAGVPCFTVFFLFWLVLYSLHGIGWGLESLLNCQGFRRNYVVALAEIVSYILVLAWYPLFFSVLHSFLASLVLICALILDTIVFLHKRRCSSILWLAYFFTALLEIYFLYVTIAFSWVK